MDEFTHWKTRLWHVLSQGYGQSIALTCVLSKYQSPTDTATAYICKQTKLINTEFTREYSLQKTTKERGKLTHLAFFDI